MQGVVELHGSVELVATHNVKRAYEVDDGLDLRIKPEAKVFIWNLDLIAGPLLP